MKFVIIGGDAAGMSAASRAKRNIPDMEVTVLEKTSDVSYSACGMPYNIAEPEVAIESLVVRQAHVFRERQGIDLRIGHRVESIDRTEKVVSGVDSEGKGFEVPYDKLLIATGATPIIPHVPGTDLPGVMSLKSLGDGRRIKDYIGRQNIKKAVIIGMGYIALEMVEALHARKIAVDMVKPRPVFIPWMNREMAPVVKEEVERHGVRLYAGHKIELELGPANAISVDKAVRTSDADIYSAGDCADAFHVVTNKKTWIPLALRANRAGWAAADNVAGKAVELQGIVGTAVFKVFDLQVARTGLSVSEAETFGFNPVEVMITARSRAHAHPDTSNIYVQMVGDQESGRLLGAQLVGKEGAAHRVNAPAVALHRRMSVAEFSQCDLAYAPPFGPTWDPMLTAANQLLKKM